MFAQVRSFENGPFIQKNIFESLEIFQKQSFNVIIKAKHYLFDGNPPKKPNPSEVNTNMKI